MYSYDSLYNYDIYIYWYIVINHVINLLQVIYYFISYTLLVIICYYYRYWW